MITKEQAMTATLFHRDGDCHYTYRRNGMTKVWKTRPNDFSVPVKYGYRGPYATIMNIERYGGCGWHVVGAEGCINPDAR